MLTAPTMFELEDLISEKNGSATVIECDSMKVFDLYKKKCIGKVKVTVIGNQFEFYFTMKNK